MIVLKNHKYKNEILRGPGLKNREKCNNQEDFLTFEVELVG